MTLSHKERHVFADATTVKIRPTAEKMVDIFAPDGLGRV
jgi:hypothetical protein